MMERVLRRLFRRVRALVFDVSAEDNSDRECRDCVHCGERKFGRLAPCMRTLYLCATEREMRGTALWKTCGSEGLFFAEDTDRVVANRLREL